MRYRNTHLQKGVKTVGVIYKALCHNPEITLENTHTHTHTYKIWEEYLLSNCACKSSFIKVLKIKIWDFSLWQST